MPNQSKRAKHPARSRPLHPGGTDKPSSLTGVRPSPGAATAQNAALPKRSKALASSGPAAPGDGRTPVRSPARPPGGLVAAALKARRRAVAPYSNFKVGAALLTRSGAVITGANVESASYGLTCCAERVALFQALTSGQREFVALAVVARAPGGPLPCGACRQLLAEYAPRATVWVADSAAPAASRAFSVQELLPAPFAQVPRDSD